MSSVNNIEELRSALSKGDDEILVKNPELAKAIKRFKNLMPQAVGGLIVGAFGLAFIPFSAIVVLAGGALYAGNTVMKMVSTLGKGQATKLLYSYHHAINESKELILRKKM